MSAQIEANVPEDTSNEGTAPAADIIDLRILVNKVRADYHRLASKEAPDEAKDAAPFHAACRAALAHLDLLLKVASSPRVPDGAADGAAADPAVEAMVARARDVLAGHPEAEE